MKKIIYLILMLFATASQSQNVSVKTHNALIDLLAQQQKLWNQGDIEGYMSYYWNSDSLKFITKHGVTTGWKPTLEMYKKHFPDKEAMGVLTFDDFTVIKLDKKTALVTGRYTVVRKNDTLTGRFSLVCRKISRKWKIILDHST